MLIELFWPIRFDVTIVSIGNNCNGKPDWPESPFGTVIKSNLIGQNYPVNQGNSLYNWMLIVSGLIQAEVEADGNFSRWRFFFNKN